MDRTSTMIEFIHVILVLKNVAERDSEEFMDKKTHLRMYSHKREVSTPGTQKREVPALITTHYVYDRRLTRCRPR